MKNPYPAALTLAATLMTTLSPLVRAGDPNTGRDLAATCTNCHGTNGRSRGGIESLAGVNKNVLLSKLHEFRSGAKPATIMHQISKGYTDEQLDLIAGWFAAQE